MEIGKERKMKKLFTSESVTEGHPDKMCDQISDAILDAIMEKDPNGRVACETTTTTGYAMVMGEISTSCYVDIPKIVRGVIKDIGYDKDEYGFDASTCAVLSAIDEQSGDIAMGVNEALERKEGTMDDEVEAIGAGDQGLMFGYACNETANYMPVTLELAHLLMTTLADIRKEGKVMTYLRPDSKSQVTVEYEGDKPVRIDTVVISHQHDPAISYASLKEAIIEKIVKPVLEPTGLLDAKTKFFINPTGRFVIGGPFGDTGLTGRKIIVDTYGGMGRHGGGAFSGKDPTKVDRSAAYMARYVAKNIVAAGLAERCELQLAYAIGVPFPVSIRVDSFGTAKVPESAIEKAVQQVFDLSPAGIIKTLDLCKPIYQATAAYGHFGRSEFSWEKTDKVDALKAAIK